MSSEGSNGTTAAGAASHDNAVELVAVNGHGNGDAKQENGHTAEDASHPAVGAAAMSSAYLTYIESLQKNWSDCPHVEITFKDLRFTIRNDATIADAHSRQARQAREERVNAVGAGGVAYASKSEENIPNIAKAGWGIVKSPLTLAKSAYNVVAQPVHDPATVLTALYPCEGVIKPKTMTLILAPPGAGKSTFLRAISGRLNGDSGLKGEIFYNGLNVKECNERGIFVTRLCSYVGQADTSFPTLTVQETLEFSRMNGVADASLLAEAPGATISKEDALKLDSQRTELLMEMLGLTECKDTAMGSDLVRGVSGGQKKRAGLGESLMTNARLYALDEVSNGLDSAVTLHIFDQLKKQCHLEGSSVVTALQQVTPETYALFDNVILMREGRILYYGPRTEVLNWLRDVLQVPFVPSSLEEAGFIVDLLSDPKQAMEKAAIAHKVATQDAAKEGRSPQSVPEVTLPIPGSTPTRQDQSVSSVKEVTFHVGSDDMFNADGASSVPASNPNKPHHNFEKKQKRMEFDSEQPFHRTPGQLETIQNMDELMQSSNESVYTQTRLAEVSLAMASSKQLAATMDVQSWSPYSKSQYGARFPHSTAYHTALCCQRQVKLMSRNLTMVIPRIFSAILMSLVYGTLFFQLKQDDFASRLGLIQNAVMGMAFANFQELPVAAEGKQVVVRQVDSGFYPAVSYTISVNLLTIPLVLVEAIIYGCVMYWIPGFVAEADRFFFWLFLLLMISSAMSQMFRTITYIASNVDVAHQMNLPFVMLFVVFGGFLIPRVSVPDWLIWAYYLSPFSWATDSLAVNEFSAGVYSDPDPKYGNVGNSYLAAFGLREEKVWQWAAVAYLAGFYFFLSTLSTFLLKHTRPTVSMGTKRPLSHQKKKKVDPSPSPSPVNGHAGNGTVIVDVAPKIKVDSVAETNGVDAPAVHDETHLSLPTDKDAAPKKKLGGARSSARKSFQLQALPFTPCTLAWKDLKYTVYVGKEKTPKVLLNHISGYAEPGKLTALMGASGAGKTTLMDVIAGRKTAGLVEFDSNIFVNGKPKDHTFEHLTGYCEQFDLHCGQATVLEALEFSAKLRLPASVTTEVRHNFVREVMELVGLTGIQNRMIGDVSQPSLSTGQLKLLTIAIELVANPSILFLDEPTTGLDAKSAYRVMKAIKRIAATNRTVVCTIHQPSQEVFFMFDRLLLLRRGGETVYFDDIGKNGETLVNYLTKVSQNILPWSPLVSPANWMLDLISLDASALVEEFQAEAEKEKGEAKEANGDLKKEVVENKPEEPGQSPKLDVVQGAEAVAATAPLNDAVQQAFRRKVLAATKSSARSSMAKEAQESMKLVEEMQPIQFSDEWKKSAEAGKIMEDIERFSKPMDVAAASVSSDFHYVSDVVRLYEVVKRAYISHWRSPPINVTRCILMFIIGLFLGLVYRDIVVKDYAGLSSLLAAIFLGVSIPSSICSNASLSTFFRQRAVYYREKSVKMYDYGIYTASMTLVELPYLFVGQMFFIIPFYFLTGLSTDPVLFWKFVFAGYVMILFFSFMEQVWISGLPNIVAAQALNGLLMNMMFAFGGLYIKASSIPVGWKWFYHADPIPKAFIATMLTQLHCPHFAPDSLDNGNIDGCRAIEVPNQGTPQAYDYVANLLEGNTDQYWDQIGWIVFTCAVVRIFSIYLFKKVNHIER